MVNKYKIYKKNIKQFFDIMDTDISFVRGSMLPIDTTLYN